MKSTHYFSEESPSKLKTTESILQNLYARATKPQNQMQPTNSNLTYQHLSSAMQQSQKQIQQRISSMLPSKKSCKNHETQPFSTQKILSVASRAEEFSKDHEHSYHCCIYENQRLKSKVQAADQQDILIQSYRQEVQYLKKINLLQTEEIDKLRKMIRIQEMKGKGAKNDSRLSQSFFQMADTKVKTNKSEKFEKNEKKVRNGIGCKERKISRKGTSKKKEMI